VAQATLPSAQEIERGPRLADQAPLAGSRVREILLGFLFLLPSLVVFGVFIFYPLARTVWLGFYESDFFGENRVWVGLSQYGDVLTSAEFRNSLSVTALFALYTVPTGLALGVGLAVLAHKPLRGIGFFRTSFSSTVATSVAVASLIWLVLLNPAIGLLTQVLPFDVLKNPGLLQSPSWALVAVSITTVWANLGFTFLIMTAGLQSIPEELYESARIDGAGGWRQFTNVTLPLLSPTLLFGFVVLTINAFQSFGQIDLLTQGGPLERTNVIVYSIYTNAFGQNVNEGVASAQAVFLFVIILILTLVQFRFLERRVHYA
jgi:multiple sugar transport system permease protein/sn-glycerol 3-phosphate transport system permease protein